MLLDPAAFIHWPQIWKDMAYIGDDIILEQTPNMKCKEELYILLDEDSFDIHPTIKDISMILGRGSFCEYTRKHPRDIWQTLAKTRYPWAERDYETGIPEPNIGEDHQ